MLTPQQAMLHRQKQDALRDRAHKFAMERQTFDMKNSWLQRSDKHYVQRTIERNVRDTMMQHYMAVQERQRRLRTLLEADEEQLVQEARTEHETPLEKQAHMRIRAQTLRDAREVQRQQLVADKLDQQFREQCQELREAQSKRRQLQVCEERAAQLHSQQDYAQLQKQEEDMFQQLWEADARAKEDRERQRVEHQHQSNVAQMDGLRQQMAAVEERRRQMKLQRDEDAQQQAQRQQLQQQLAERERRLSLDAAQARRRMLDDSLRLKKERLAKEEQDELQLDMSILQQTLQDESQHQQDTADKKAELRDEQLRFRQYLAEQLKKRKEDEEEMEQLMEDKLKETWDRRDKQNFLQQEARNRLMEEVMESRRLQTAHKQHVNMQKRLEAAKERDELNAAFHEMKRADEEQKKRQRQAYVVYQADLRAQIEQRQQLRREQEAEDAKQKQQVLTLEQQQQQKKEQVLTRPTDGASHPFRRYKSPASQDL
ncbi:cilia- and flagella-associated protein 53 [Dunckerocampus dactyliophorus]|uniref:cilia- and flagella-associated protein 53 n=1 Tax=Dunckerocampus dactyliophorus TaxID=161453 RepID=UPI002405CE16|nr:cilia- and flagella-associated protein 53 [Dunckerocampus dactyliophorus]XP_054613260.1 cilia- and flagella-associated protein 53 [Dunckerocampus dactyliophorus]XP_054613261.1 cilia- and flagella-associated protein 53 [Dunckerocampus dactyliophorus]